VPDWMIADGKKKKSVMTQGDTKSAIVMQSQAE
jgi:hypothetical protein